MSHGPLSHNHRFNVSLYCTHRCNFWLRPFTQDQISYLSYLLDISWIKTNSKNNPRYTVYDTVQNSHTVLLFFVFCEENEKYMEPFIKTPASTSGNVVYKTKTRLCKFNKTAFIRQCSLNSLNQAFYFFK